MNSTSIQAIVENLLKRKRPRIALLAVLANGWFHIFFSIFCVVETGMLNMAIESCGEREVIYT